MTSLDQFDNTATGYDGTLHFTSTDGQATLPANRTLTAYGLMEFTDMARVHDVDPAIVARTRKWLLDQRQSDGTWQPV